MAFAQVATARELLTEADLSVVSELLIHAEETAQNRHSRAEQQLSRAMNQLSDAVQGNPEIGCGCLRDVPSLQATVREAARAGVKDYMTMSLVVLLVLTVYRLPPFLAQVCDRMLSTSKERPFTKFWFFFVVLGNVRKVMRDLLLVIEILAYSLLVCITLVRMVDLFGELLQNLTSLSAMRDAAWRNLAAVWESLWELLLLVTAWKSYKVLVKATLFLVALPAAFIHFVILHFFYLRAWSNVHPHGEPQLSQNGSGGDPSSPCHVAVTVSAPWTADGATGARLPAQGLAGSSKQQDIQVEMEEAVPIEEVPPYPIIDEELKSCASYTSLGVWLLLLLLCCSPVVISSISLPTWLLSLALCNGILLSLGLMCQLMDPKLNRLDLREWHTICLRISGPNCLILASTVFDAVCLASLLPSVRQAWPLLADLCSSMEAGAAAVVALYLLLVAIPWVSNKEDQDAVRASSFYIWMNLLLQCLYVPTTASLAGTTLQGALSPSAPTWNSTPALPVWLSALLLLFLLATFQLGNVTHTARLASVHRVDIRYPAAYMCGFRLLQAAIVMAALLPEMTLAQSTAACVTAILATVMLVFDVAYPTICTVPAMRPIRCSATIALVATAVLNATEPGHFATHHDHIALGWGGLLVLGVLVAVVFQKQAYQEEQARLAATDLPSTLAALAQVRNRVLTSHEDHPGFQSGAVSVPEAAEISCPQQAALALKEFESCVVAHRMSIHFLMGRKDWLSAVDDAKNSYRILAGLATALHDEISDPHTLTQMLRFLRAWNPRGDESRLPHWVCMQILGYSTPIEYVELASIPLCAIRADVANPWTDWHSSLDQVDRFIQFLADMEPRTRQQPGPELTEAAVVNRLLASHSGGAWSYASGDQVIALHQDPIGIEGTDAQASGSSRSNNTNNYNSSEGILVVSGQDIDARSRFA